VKRFENPLVGGAAVCWRRGGYPPHPGFPHRGNRKGVKSLLKFFLPSGGRFKEWGFPPILGKRKPWMGLSFLIGLTFRRGIGNGFEGHAGSGMGWAKKSLGSRLVLDMC
jgi:hypothetical protein